MMSVASKQYETLVKRLKTERTLWEDPDFPANDYAIGNIPNFREKIEWKRPHVSIMFIFWLLIITLKLQSYEIRHCLDIHTIKLV